MTTINEIHYIPAFDSITHIESGDCQCRPLGRKGEWFHLRQSWTPQAEANQRIILGGKRPGCFGSPPGGFDGMACCACPVSVACAAYAAADTPATTCVVVWDERREK